MSMGKMAEGEDVPVGAGLERVIVEAVWLFRSRGRLQRSFVSLGNLSYLR